LGVIVSGQVINEMTTPTAHDHISWFLIANGLIVQVVDVQKFFVAAKHAPVLGIIQELGAFCFPGF
jgi:hypothetical protein